jgi:hypothetical protein
MGKKLRWISGDGVYLGGVELKHGRVYEVGKDISISALSVWGFEEVRESKKTESSSKTTSKTVPKTAGEKKSA